MEVSWSELQRRSQTEVEMEEGKSGLGATKRNPPDFSRFLSDILTTPIPVHSHCLREPQLVTVIMLNLLSRPSLPMFGGSSIGPLAAFRWSSTATQDTIAFLQQQRQQKSPRAYQRQRAASRARLLEENKMNSESRAMEKFQTREWRRGEIYSPHDLSPAEMRKWKRRQSPPTDAFDSLNKNPLDLYKNFSIMSEYMTPMGRIKHRSTTGLRPVNQRKIAKAIRRSIGLGLMPSVHRHPEILAAEAKAKMDGSTA